MGADDVAVAVDDLALDLVPVGLVLDGAAAALVAWRAGVLAGMTGDER